MSIPQRLLTEPQAAKHLAISPRKLWSIRKAGEIKYILDGRSIRYDMNDIHTWVLMHSRGGDVNNN